MKRIISERFVTYAANEKWPSTARITIKMCDAIDQAMMQDALAATQQRYPYFCVRFRITNGDDGREYFALEDNPQPWVMQQTSKPSQTTTCWPLPAGTTALPLTSFMG